MREYECPDCQDTGYITRWTGSMYFSASTGSVEEWPEVEPCPVCNPDLDAMEASGELDWWLGELEEVWA
jgi:hypothetical protein